LSERLSGAVSVAHLFVSCHKALNSAGGTSLSAPWSRSLLNLGFPPFSWRAVEELLERMPDLSLTDPEEPAHRPANFVSGYEGLGVRFGASAPATT